MPSIETSVAFFGLALLLAFAPGPDNLVVAMQAASQGRKSGLLVVLGLCTGLLVHTAAVSLGLAAIFAASAMAFVVLKFIGAGYLAFLAWQALRAPATGGDGAGGPAVSPRGLYVRRIMNLTNPKVVLFFLAFLPQFVDPRVSSVALQLTWFGFVFILATLVDFGTITILAAQFGRLFGGTERAQRVMSRISALVFAGLALRLATTAR
jgi:threonine/homoserine/homoserine lactone efflux protein